MKNFYIFFKHTQNLHTIKILKNMHIIKKICIFIAKFYLTNNKILAERIVIVNYHKNCNYKRKECKLQLAIVFQDLRFLRRQLHRMMYE